MKLKSACIFVIISSFIWILSQCFWFVNGIYDGWINFDEWRGINNIIDRLLMFLPPIALIFLSFSLLGTQNLKSHEASNQSIQSSNNTHSVSLGGWLITFLILCIPIVGIVMLFVWSYGNSNPIHPSKKTWAQAMLVWLLILTVLYGFFFMIIFLGYNY